MFKSYIKLFIKNCENVKDPAVRRKYGTLCGVTGIVLNILMCTAKIVTGLITGAISILSDGINNLSDAGSSVITLLGFKLSAKKPDKEHPFGHGRMEYFAGLAVSVIILIVAVQLLMDSIDKIIYGVTPKFDSPVTAYVTFGILGFSIIIKLWMAILNRYSGKKINSVALTSTFLDCVTDCISTSVVLACTVLSFFVTEFSIDGIAGVIVSLFIVYTGIRSIKEVMDVLLGQAPDKELVDDIAKFVIDYDARVVGVHDIMLHDYGPGRKILNLHVEVPASGNVLELHDMVDNIERGLEKQFNCLATLHMDPVETESERVKELKQLCVKIVHDIDNSFSLHDFRMNEGETHANLIFDVVITHEKVYIAEQIQDIINGRLKEIDQKLNAVVTVEYPFV